MPANHTNLITTLTNFYTLLKDLTILPPHELLLPTSPTNTIPSADPAVYSSAALAAGYNPAIIDLVARLPQLKTCTTDGEWLLYSTYFRNFLKDWGWDREIYELVDEEGEGKMWPPDVLCLTRSNRYGVLLGYEVESGLLRAWEPFGEAHETWRTVPALPPSEVFAPWIQKYRSLTWLAAPLSSDPNRFPTIDGYEREPCKEYPTLKKSDKPLWRAQKRVDAKIWRVKQKIRALYFECGWDVDAAGPQTGFDRERFLKLRTDFWTREVVPLQKRGEEIIGGSRRERRERDFAEEDLKAVEEGFAWTDEEESDGDHAEDEDYVPSEDDEDGDEEEDWEDEAEWSADEEVLETNELHELEAEKNGGGERC